MPPYDGYTTDEPDPKPKTPADKDPLAGRSGVYGSGVEATVKRHLPPFADTVPEVADARRSLAEANLASRESAAEVKLARTRAAFADGADRAAAEAALRAAIAEASRRYSAAVDAAHALDEAATTHRRRIEEAAWNRLDTAQEAVLDAHAALLSALHTRGDVLAVLGTTKRHSAAMRLDLGNLSALVYSLDPDELRAEHVRSPGSS